MQTHYPDSQMTSLCSFSLMLHVCRKATNTNFIPGSHWFDLTLQFREHIVGAVFQRQQILTRPPECEV